MGKGLFREGNWLKSLFLQLFVMPLFWLFFGIKRGLGDSYGAFRKWRERPSAESMGDF